MAQRDDLQRQILSAGADGVGVHFEDEEVFRGAVGLEDAAEGLGERKSLLIKRTIR